MLRSFLLRLVPRALRRGRVAGTIEAVESGRSTTFRDLDELISFIALEAGNDALPPGPIPDDEEA